MSRTRIDNATGRRRFFPRVTVATDDDHRKVTSPSTGMAIALTMKTIYGGTVDPVEITRRRAKNKAARKARRAARR